MDEIKQHNKILEDLMFSEGAIRRFAENDAKELIKEGRLSQEQVDKACGIYETRVYNEKPQEVLLTLKHSDTNLLRENAENDAKELIKEGRLSQEQVDKACRKKLDEFQFDYKGNYDAEELGDILRKGTVFMLNSSIDLSTFDTEARIYFKNIESTLQVTKYALQKKEEIFQEYLKVDEQLAESWHESINFQMELITKYMRGIWNNGVKNLDHIRPDMRALSITMPQNYLTQLNEHIEHIPQLMEEIDNLMSYKD